MNNIGRRLRYFRLQKNQSQMNVELSINAAFGSLSRIESGKVNPTLATIEKISKTLKLSDTELDYLVGPTSVEATFEECTVAIKEVDGYLNEKGVIGYIHDDRFRMLKMSQTALKMLNLSPQQEEEILGKTLVELMLIDAFHVKKCFLKDYEINVKLVLKRFMEEVGHMADDPIYRASLKAIREDPIADKIWTEMSKTPSSGLFNYIDNFVKFNYRGISMQLRCVNEPLLKYKRFTIVEYIPTNQLLRLMAKII